MQYVVLETGEIVQEEIWREELDELAKHEKAGMIHILDPI